MSLQDLHRTFALDSVPVQVEGFSIQKIPCCWVFSKKKQQRRIKLNDSSMMIWQLCIDGNSVGGIIDRLQTQFPEVSGMEKDIQRALDELLDEGLISI